MLKYTHVCVDEITEFLFFFHYTDISDEFLPIIDIDNYN